jgi:aryl-alcohol dehydrogenase-like predicted oxidoreductase
VVQGAATDQEIVVRRAVEVGRGGGEAPTRDGRLRQAERRLEAGVRVEPAGNQLAELASRYAVFAPGMSCALIGTASLGQLEAALAAVAKGPLPAAALARIAELLA